MLCILYRSTVILNVLHKLIRTWLFWLQRWYEVGRFCIFFFSFFKSFYLYGCEIKQSIWCTALILRGFTETWHLPFWNCSNLMKSGEKDLVIFNAELCQSRTTELQCAGSTFKRPLLFLLPHWLSFSIHLKLMFLFLPRDCVDVLAYV